MRALGMPKITTTCNWRRVVWLKKVKSERNQQKATKLQQLVGNCIYHIIDKCKQFFSSVFMCLTRTKALKYKTNHQTGNSFANRKSVIFQSIIENFQHILTRENEKMNNYSTHFWTPNFTFFFFSFPCVFSSENLKYTEYDTHTEIVKRYFLPQFRENVHCPKLRPR